MTVELISLMKVELRLVKWRSLDGMSHARRNFPEFIFRMGDCALLLFEETVPYLLLNFCYQFQGFGFFNFQGIS